MMRAANPFTHTTSIQRFIIKTHLACILFGGALSVMARKQL